MSELMILLLVLVGPFVVPFLVGLKVESTKRGLIPLAALPTLSFFAGLAIVIGMALFKTNDLDMALFALLLIAVAIYLGCVFSICWGLGHVIRERLQARQVSKTPAPIGKQSPVVGFAGDTKLPGTHDSAPGSAAFRSTASVSGEIAIANCDDPPRQLVGARHPTLNS